MPNRRAVLILAALAIVAPVAVASAQGMLRAPTPPSAIKLQC